MANDKMPVSTTVLKWARERSGYELQWLPPDYEQWENGVSRPTYLELEKLASQFQIPVAVFFFPSPPELPEPNLEFRTMGPGAFADLPPRMQYLMERASLRRQNVQTLFVGKHASKRMIVHDIVVTPDMGPESLAKTVRDYLSIDSSTQLEWSRRNKSFEMWRKTLAAVGVTVTVMEFRTDEYKSFALYDPRVPLICLGRSEWFWSGLLTLGHSLVHLLFHTSGVDRVDDSFISSMDSECRRIEELCNHACWELIVPRSDLEELLSLHLRSLKLSDTTSQLAYQFDVPERLINDRLLKLDLISESHHAETLEVWSRRPGIGGGGYPPPHELALIELGEPFIRLAIESFDNGLIDEETLAEYVELPICSINDLRQTLAGA